MNGICHRQPREVAFADTDASGRVHFSTILTYAENAEHEYLGKLGIMVFDRAEGGWPRIKVSCEYKKPLLFQDRIEVLLSIDHVGASSVVWKFEILKADGTLAARGEMVAVKVNASGQGAAITDAEKKLLEGVA